MSNVKSYTNFFGKSLSDKNKLYLDLINLINEEADECIKKLSVSDRNTIETLYIRNNLSNQVNFLNILNPKVDRKNIEQMLNDATNKLLHAKELETGITINVEKFIESLRLIVGKSTTSSGGLTEKSRQAFSKLVSAFRKKRGEFNERQGREAGVLGEAREAGVLGEARVAEVPREAWIRSEGVDAWIRGEEEEGEEAWLTRQAEEAGEAGVAGVTGEAGESKEQIVEKERKRFDRFSRDKDDGYSQNIAKWTEITEWINKLTESGPDSLDTIISTLNTNRWSILELVVKEDIYEEKAMCSAFQRKLQETKKIIDENNQTVVDFDRFSSGVSDSLGLVIYTNEYR